MSALCNLSQSQITWLLQQGVPASAIGNAESSIWSARGYRADDGRFDADPDGDRFYAFPEPHDIVYWNPETGALATEHGRAFALGEARIGNPYSLAFDRHLCIFDNPLIWLRNERLGIVVLDWKRAFDRLRNCARIACAESLIETYRKNMKPQLPQLAVLNLEEKAASP